ncbi:hypothetical protein [Rothia santali]|nr:hypothetical protein [Rothia santali]
MNPFSQVDDSCIDCGLVPCICGQPPQLDLFSSADRRWAERDAWE